MTEDTDDEPTVFVDSVGSYVPVSSLLDVASMDDLVNDPEAVYVAIRQGTFTLENLYEWRDAIIRTKRELS